MISLKHCIATNLNVHALGILIIITLNTILSCRVTLLLSIDAFTHCFITTKVTVAFTG